MAVGHEKGKGSHAKCLIISVSLVVMHAQTTKFWGVSWVFYNVLGLVGCFTMFWVLVGCFTKFQVVVL